MNMENTDITEAAEVVEMKEALAEAFRSNSMLVTMTQHRFPLKVADHVAARNAETAGQATVGSVAAQKNRLQGADARWRAVSTEMNTAYTKHRELTSEWGTTSQARLLTNAMWTHYIQHVGESQKRIAAARADFVAHYDDDVAIAKANLGKYAPSDYPSAIEAGNQFRLDVDFEPIAAGVSPHGLPTGAPEWLADRFAKKTVENSRIAIDNVLNRVKEHTQNLLTNLQQEKQFRSASIENIVDLVPMVRSFGFTGDNRFGQLADEIERQLGHFDLKSMKKAGKDAIPAVEAVIDRLGAWDVSDG